eukprot:1070506-Rhodomonas_salina.1
MLKCGGVPALLLLLAHASPATKEEVPSPSPPLPSPPSASPHADAWHAACLAGCSRIRSADAHACVCVCACVCDGGEQAVAAIANACCCFPPNLEFIRNKDKAAIKAMITSPHSQEVSPPLSLPPPLPLSCSSFAFFLLRTRSSTAWGVGGE